MSESVDAVSLDGRDTGPRQRAARRGRTVLIVAAALLGGVVGGTGGFALAAGPWHGGWHHGPRLERIQKMVLGSLDAVGATSVQEGKIHDIIAAAFQDLTRDPAKRAETRKEMLDLLKAPTIDRAAVEKLRSEQIAALDAKSKTLVGALLDSADQLTPDQRAKLADRLEQMAALRAEYHEPGSDRHRNQAHDQPDGDQAPDQGSGHAPD